MILFFKIDDQFIPLNNTFSFQIISDRFSKIESKSNEDKQFYFFYGNCEYVLYNSFLNTDKLSVFKKIFIKTLFERLNDAVDNSKIKYLDLLKFTEDCLYFARIDNFKYEENS